jgi:peroxiredoxin
MSLVDESNAHRDRAKQMLGEKFDVLTQGIEELRASHLAERAAKVEQQAPDFTLPDSGGNDVSLAALLASGPVVLSFYRGEWCPFCNLELAAFQRVLPRLEALGATLVAVSPEKPDFGQLLADKQKLTFPVLSDLGNAVARAYGLVFTLDAASKAMSLNMFHRDLAERNGDDSWELPIPATFVIDRSGVIRFAHVDPNYMVGRADPELVLAALERLAPGA